MASLATRVDHVECAHDLEAGVRELRLLAAHAPPYNRRSKFPHRWWWVVLTDEAFPRFSVVRAPKHDHAIGPFRARADAVETAALLARYTGIRTCTARLGRAATHGPSCVERELSPCPAPRGVTADYYAATVDGAQQVDRGHRRHRAARRVGAHRRAGEPRPVRDRGAAARSRGHRHRRALEGAATAGADSRRRARRGPARRRGRLAARRHPARSTGRGGQRHPRRSAHTRRRCDLRCRTSDSAVPLPRWAGRSSRRRVCSPVGSVNPGCASCVRSRAMPPQSGRRAGWPSWSATARSAHIAAKQASRGRRTKWSGCCIRG